MLAMAGGERLATADMPTEALILVFVVLSAFFNLFIGSMSAKYAILAPIFVPMFMLVGISPELTQMAYRVGDSVTNIITPLNSYMVIILVVMQRFAPKGGMGTMIAMMLPYTIFFLIAWAVMLIVWLEVGAPLGIKGPLEYVPSAALSAPVAE
jgi:aminobenzoyl-glutamate transport protein